MMMRNEGPIFFVGSSKNAGKTTAMLSMANKLREEGHPLVFMSTGRDGEVVDRVTGTPKPSLYLEDGDLVITTWSGIIEGRAEVLSPLGGRAMDGTPALWRILGGARVETAGLLTASAVWEAIRVVRSLDSERVILVDGALDRWAALSRGRAAMVLVVSPMGTVDRTVDWLSRRLRLLTLPLWQEGMEAIHVDGPLYTMDGIPDDSMVVVLSPMHVFLSDQEFDRHAHRLLVTRRPQVLGIALNPWRPDGTHVPPHSFLKSVRSAIAPRYDIPVWMPLLAW